MPNLSPRPQEFVRRWGDFSVRGRVNRTVAEALALLFLSQSPRSAEEAAAALRVARSNASTSLRELESWGLVKPMHVRGDRHQRCEAVKDVWEIFRLILDGRKRREIDRLVIKGNKDGC